jgi:hypothetical protein
MASESKAPYFAELIIDFRRPVFWIEFATAEKCASFICCTVRIKVSIKVEFNDTEIVSNCTIAVINDARSLDHSGHAKHRFT